MPAMISNLLPWHQSLPRVPSTTRYRRTNPRNSHAWQRRAAQSRPVSKLVSLRQRRVWLFRRGYGAQARSAYRFPATILPIPSQGAELSRSSGWPGAQPCSLCSGTRSRQAASGDWMRQALQAGLPEPGGSRAGSSAPILDAHQDRSGISRRSKPVLHAAGIP